MLVKHIKDFNSLFNSIPMGVFIVDANKRVLDANTLALDILKYTREELVGQICHHFICAKQEGNCPVFDLGWEVNNKETVIVRKDRLHIPVLKSCQRIELDGIDVAIEGFIDITDRKAMEEEYRVLQDRLLQAQKMEALGTLASGVAHEFRNVLTPIIGYVEFLEELVNDTKQINYLDIIKLSAKRGADIANRVLSLSREAHLSFEEIDLRDMARHVIKLMSGSARHDIKVKFRYRTKFRRLYADRGLLEQVLMNLMLNAYEAMPEGGTITLDISSAKTPIPCPVPAQGKTLREGRFFKVSVTDTGIGMDDKTLASSFEPFYTTKGPKGTGLGLFLAFNIAERHNGCIIAESKKGVGSTFTLYLPAESTY